MPETKLGTNLTLEQSRREFRLEPLGTRVIERTILPSPPYGAWVGNNVTIRHWQIFRRGYSENCTLEEIDQLEQILGEWKKIAFIDHPSLGLVSTEDKN